MFLLKRFSAFVLDVCIIVLIENIFVTMTQFDPGNIMFYSDSVYSETLGRFVNYGIGHSIMVVVLYFLYNLMMELSPTKATLGKLIFKLEVINREDNELNFLQTLIRNVFKTVFTFSYLNFIFIWFTPNNFTVHDFLSWTRVKSRKKLNLT